MGGPSFRFSPLPAIGTAFPLSQIAFQEAGDHTLTADSAAAVGATATVIDSSWGTPKSGQLRLQIPGAEVDAVVKANNFFDPNGPTTLADGRTLQVDDADWSGTSAYVLAGDWRLTTAGGSESAIGYFTLGYQTPSAGMPASGVANYHRTESALYTLASRAPGAPAVQHGDDGEVQLAVNFGTGAVTGSINFPSAGLGAVSANISNTGFTGTFNLGGPGTITGGFYGPKADEIAGRMSVITPNSEFVGSFQAPRLIGPPDPAAALTIQAPAIATVGFDAPSTAAAGLQQAVLGGPNFSAGGPAPSAGTVFALTQTSLSLEQEVSATSKGLIGPDVAINGAGATIAVQDATNSQVEVKIPGLSIDAFLAIGNGTSVRDDGNIVTNYEVPLGNLSYVLLGRWAYYANFGNSPTNIGEVLGGFQTPTSGMPTTGSATYSLAGGVAGWAVVPGVSSSGITPYTPVSIRGDASFTANFRTGQVTGSFTNMLASDISNLAPGPSQAWNNISISASISGAAVSGTTTTTSTPSGSLAFASGTGTIKGGFYGPNADEIGAIWTLYDGTRAAIGSVGAKKAPSDRRLKRDIEPLGQLANGLELYRYRYLGDDRTFVGVMAQDLLADSRFADAAIPDTDGLYWVDYGRLGLEPNDLDQMVQAGRGAIAVYLSSGGDQRH